MGPSLGKHKISSLRAKLSAFQVRGGKNGGDNFNLLKFMRIKDIPKTCPVVNTKCFTTGVERPREKLIKNMGKYERQQIEEAEKIIVKVLNFRKLNSFDKKNHWFKHSIALVKKLQKDFPNIEKVRHLGNRYDNTGDILIISKGKESFVEIKMSDTKTGIGTKANISQDALTENHLFGEKIKSWSKFRQDKGHERWVNNYLDRFTRYPKHILKITNFISQKEEKAKYLRELSKKGNKKAKSILSDIQKKDRQEKIGYLIYLSNQKQQQKMIKRFFILITSGIHRKEELENLIKKDNFFQEIQNLFVYYSNILKGKITVRKEDVGERIKKILEKYSDFKIIFPKGLTHCKIIGVKEKDFKPLLQIVFHWKNIAQGIKTPCLNIFDLTA